METGSQLLSYEGDVRKGFGSNADVPVVTPAGASNIINDTAKNMMLLNHENNVKIFNQKIADRDVTLQMLEKGAISSGAIEPEDRKFFNESEGKVNKAFEEVLGFSAEEMNRRAIEFGTIVLADIESRSKSA